MEVFAYNKRFILTAITEQDKDPVLSLCQKANPDSADTAVFNKLSKMEKPEQFSIKVDEIFWQEITSESNLNCMIRAPYDNIIYGRIVLQGYKKELPELGIDIFPEHQNHGIAPEAIKLFLKYCYYYYNIKTVKVRIRKDNFHSNHVFRKLGAKYRYDESFFSQAILSMLKEELNKSDISSFERKTINVYHLSIEDIKC